MLPTTGFGWQQDLPVNWKSVRDVDNEGDHLAMAHPVLQDLQWRTYRDLTYRGGLRALNPVLNLRRAPPEGEMAARSAELICAVLLPE